MRLLHSPLPPPLLTSFAPRKTSILPKKASLNYAQKPLQQALSTGISLVLSLGLLVSAPNSIFALESPSVLQPSNSLNCPENEVEEVYSTEVSKVVSNERIVEEAWQIVNDSFLNTSPRSWSPESWLVSILFSLYLSFWDKGFLLHINPWLNILLLPEKERWHLKFINSDKVKSSWYYQADVG